MLWKVEGAVPVVWMGMADFDNHDLFEEENLEDLYDAEDMITAAAKMADYLWDGTFGEEFNDALEYAATVLEIRRIERCKKEELPLLVGRIKQKESKKLLDERIKNA